jgi:glycosyltransferase involved in cell wall biosynthesis
MRIAALSQFYVPNRNAGSEVMLHTMLRRLVQDGHEVVVFATDQPDAPKYRDVDGVAVLNSNLVMAQQHIKATKPDVLIAQHKPAFQAARVAEQIGCPWVLLIHSDPPFVRQQLRLGADLAVFNTNWLLEKYRPMTNAKSMLVVHPPVIAQDHATERGEHVTLVNLSRDKGGDRLYWLAEWMPERKFLGVEGGYQVQLRSSRHQNVEFVPHTTNMKRDVWSRTRVLLMPSVYESYGMAGVEAMASGIPVIAHPTPGLIESLDYAGIFVDRDDIDGYADALEALDDPDYYQERSDLALKRSNELNPEHELDHWSRAIRSLTSGTD